MRPSDSRIVLLGVFLCLCCASYFPMLDSVIFSSRHFAPIFFCLLHVYDERTAWIALLVCVLAACWTRADGLLWIVGRLGAYPAAVAVVGTVLFSTAAVYVYQNYPLSMDEYAAVFQSKTFASGHIAAQLPASVVDWLIAPGFNGHFLLISPQTGRAIEAYWPGFALLLAPFQLVGLPWACNGVLAGASLFLIYRVTEEITGDRRAGGWALLFALASSGFWANAISYYSMQAHLTANLLYVWLLLRPTPWKGLAAGLVGSVALLLHNPVPHLLFAVPWTISLAVEPRTRRVLPPLILGYMPALAAGMGWAWLERDIQVAAQGTGMVSDAISGVFSWPDATILNMRVAAAVKMWVWALPCVFLFAFMGVLRFRGNRHVRLLALSAATTFCGYLFVKFDQGHGWGYRYFHSAWGVIPVLAACSLAAPSDERARLVSFAGASAALSLMILIPLQLFQIHGFIEEHLDLVPLPLRPGNNVYFIDTRGGKYIADEIQIDPLLRSQDLVLSSRGNSLDAELVRQNWPGAEKSGSGRWVEQWYLGPEDRRIVPPGANGARRFALKFQAEASPIQTTPEVMSPSPSHCR
jgi:hypothetical protein